MREAPSRRLPAFTARIAGYRAGLLRVVDVDTGWVGAAAVVHAATVRRWSELHVLERFVACRCRAWSGAA